MPRNCTSHLCSIQGLAPPTKAATTRSRSKSPAVAPPPPPPPPPPHHESTFANTTSTGGSPAAGQRETKEDAAPTSGAGARQNSSDKEHQPAPANGDILVDSPQAAASVNDPSAFPSAEASTSATSSAETPPVPPASGNTESRKRTAASTSDIAATKRRKAAQAANLPPLPAVAGASAAGGTTKAKEGRKETIKAFKRKDDQPRALKNYRYALPSLEKSFKRQIIVNDAIGIMFITHASDFGGRKKRPLPFYRVFHSRHFDGDFPGKIPTKSFHFSSRSVPFTHDKKNKRSDMSYRAILRGMKELFSRVVLDVQEKEAGRAGADVVALSKKNDDLEAKVAALEAQLNGASMSPEPAAGAAGTAKGKGKQREREAEEDHSSAEDQDQPSSDEGSDAEPGTDDDID
ncbi:hypothetical protein JCM11641_001781 [Rhodosporidiobolus odoratus]